MVSSPKPPDPVKTAQVQGQMNKETAVAQYGLQATNMKGPDGDVTWDQIGKWDDGTPRFQQTTTLSPEQQALYNTTNEAAQKYGGIANRQIDAVNDRLSTPWDIDDAAGRDQANMQRTFLDPEWDSRSEKMESTLANRGLNPGSQAYKNATREFGDSRARAYDAMYLDSRRTAIDTAQRERDQPLKELAALLSGSQPNTPQFSTPTPTPGVAPVDYTGLVQNNYNQQVAASNAKMGGIFGMASMLPMFGGWSDRRLKTDIVQIARHAMGWGVYAFRYLWDAPGARRVGYMADEVGAIMPMAVHVAPNGYAMIDYWMTDHG